MDHGRAFFVLGPESSGTRLATEILIAAGCHGSSDHVQPLDDPQFDLQSVPISTPVVWRRSFPHNFEMPSLRVMLDRINPRKAMAIVTIRDWYCIAQSQIRDNQHATSIEQADYNIEYAYEMVFHKLRLHGVQFRTLVYEAMVLSPVAQSRFLEGLGLTSTSLIDVCNGNAKYWSTDQL